MNCIVHPKHARAFLDIQHECIDIPCLNFQILYPNHHSHAPSDRIPSLPPRDLALNMANIPRELHQNPWVGHRCWKWFLRTWKIRKTCTSGCLYKSPHTQTKKMQYKYIIHIYICYTFLYIFARGSQKKMSSCFLWGPHLIVSRNFLTVPRCKSIVDPIRTRKWIHLVQYPTPVAAGIWILNLKMYGWMKIQASSSIIEKCKQYTSITSR